MRRSAILMLILAAAAATPAGSSEGRIPVWMPADITQPGHYILTRDVLAPSGPVLRILADGVTLDLNGHTVGTSDTTQPVIHIGGSSAGEKGIVVIGGKVQGGMYGIQAAGIIDDGKVIQLSNLTIAGSSGAAVKGTGFSRLEAQGIIVIDGKVGFDLQAAEPPDPVAPIARLRNVSVSGGGGIHCTGVICSVHDFALEYEAPSAVPRTPALRFSGATGGEAVGIIIINSIPSPTDPPIVDVLETCWLTLSRTKIVGPAGGGQPCVALDSLSRDFIIDDGDLSRCGGDGIRTLGTNGRIRRMLISGTGGHGIFAGGSNLIIDDGKIAGSSGAAIWFDTPGHVYRNNTVRGNAGGGVAGPGASDATDAGGNVE